MGRNIFLTMMVVLAAFGLAACGEDTVATAPKPVELTRDATGHYCRMIVLDHKGPKGQIHVKGRTMPVWFSSVRDTIAFTLLPDEPKQIRAIYVNDMSRATWDRPEPATWIDARKAVYVIGSSRRGGMGATEAVPFSDRAAAEAFAGKFGGRLVTLKEIPRSYILGSSGTAPSYGSPNHNSPGQSHMGTDHKGTDHKTGHGEAHKDMDHDKGQRHKTGQPHGHDANKTKAD